VVLPPTTNDFIALLKDSSLVSVITMVELTRVYGQLAAMSYITWGSAYSRADVRADRLAFRPPFALGEARLAVEKRTRPADQLRPPRRPLKRFQGEPTMRQT